jgi:ABC-type sugar transport system ATPase subunit
LSDVILEKVVKKFGAVTAVHALDLHIREGEFVALLGPSGCGKTTTLRMLAGLDFPTSGDIRIGDRTVNDVPPGKRDIAMVFQSYALYPHMTVEQNIAYPLKKRRVPKAERVAMVARTAELLHLGELMKRKPRQLSGGQQQRVALGRALVREPQVFLLDEPLSNLDAKLRSYMRAELIQLHRRLGRTLVYVTHDQLEAMTMSNRIAVMNAGRLQQFGTPDEVYRRPANRFVAEFIGTPSMNLADGEVTDDGHFRTGPFTHRLAPSRFDLTPGPATLGVRPEGISIGAGPLVAEVRVVEPTGHENIVVLESGGLGALTVRTAANDRPRIGETVRIALDETSLHLFGGEDGRRRNRDDDVQLEPIRRDAG